MSKNVAVFVDVANVFYAAKAAGVDIDYVQMLKTASAGRDLVRAYAYTGLDPDNENQRQFHSFLARHGYKVVSKDIRKYGDGKTKANLDIELVVDLMRTSHNLDIAVVVSGDGDFAPAIRAVQDQGVRVEVISFRANTSSDLIEVADQFTDITQIAKVEKGSSRSGRRVASDEDDLSMTAVPEKESDGTGARRRRGSRGRGTERQPREARREPAEVEALVGAENGEGLVALPGERLSRAPRGRPAGQPLEPAERAPEEGQAGTEGEAQLDPDGEAGRRRRRRRGGRGRGRSHDQEAVAATAGPVEDEEPEALVGFEAPRLPQHSTFGSVWDSQLGVTATSLPPGEPFDVEDEDEPEIPEYLLSERRQRGTRGRGPGGPAAQGGRRPRGRAGAYQTALERERFGTGRSSLPTPAYEGGRRTARPSGPGRQGGDRSFGQRGGSPPPRLPREERGFAPTGGQPWSEVPPELEEQLRAEFARKRASSSPAQDAAPPTAVPQAAELAKPTRPTRARKPAVAVGDGASGATDVATVRPATRTRRTATAPEPADAAAVAVPQAAKAKRATRTRQAAPSASSEAPSAEVGSGVTPARRASRTRKTTESPPSEA